MLGVVPGQGVLARSPENRAIHCSRAARDNARTGDTLRTRPQGNGPIPVREHRFGREDGAWPAPYPARALETPFASRGDRSLTRPCGLYPVLWPFRSTTPWRGVLVRTVTRNGSFSPLGQNSPTGCSSSANGICGRSWPSTRAHCNGSSLQPTAPPAAGPITLSLISPESGWVWLVWRERLIWGIGS
jgi:hypothetical protein